MLLAALLLYFGVTLVQVWSATRADERAESGAIVVLGAAQYDGRPSRVLRARLDHAMDLYDDGLAPEIWVTGGNRPGDRFTEAGAAAAYLYGQGVPGSAVELITTGSTSYESLAASARFLRRRDINKVLLVSDPFHSLRVAGIADEVGLEAGVSPTPYSPFDGLQRWRQLIRETAAVSLGRLVGYRRLDWLEPRVPSLGQIGGLPVPSENSSSQVLRRRWTGVAGLEPAATTRSSSNRRVTPAISSTAASKAT